MKTQALIAERWKKNGLFPHATDAGAGRQGNDILNTPGLKAEVKARDTVTLPAALAQAAADPDPGMPVVLWRHNGQGEAAMDDWTATMRLKDWESLWWAATEYHRRVHLGQIEREEQDEDS